MEYFLICMLANDHVASIQYQFWQLYKTMADIKLYKIFKKLQFSMFVMGLERKNFTTIPLVKDKQTPLSTYSKWITSDIRLVFFVFVVDVPFPLFTFTQTEFTRKDCVHHKNDRISSRKLYHHLHSTGESCPQLIEF